MWKTTVIRFGYAFGGLTGIVGTAAGLLPTDKIPGMKWWYWASFLVLSAPLLLIWARVTSRSRQISFVADDEGDASIEVPASEDMLAAASRYGQSVYGRDAIKRRDFGRWQRANRLSIAVMRGARGHYQGHFDILPLNDDAAGKVLDGSLTERKLGSDHILPESRMQDANFLYLAGICVTGHERGEGDRRSAQLIGGLATFLRVTYPERPLRTRRILATAATSDGERLLREPLLEARLVRAGEGRKDGHNVYEIILTNRLIKAVLARSTRRAPPAPLPPEFSLPVPKLP